MSQGFTYRRKGGRIRQVPQQRADEGLRQRRTLRHTTSRAAARAAPHGRRIVQQGGHQQARRVPGRALPQAVPVLQRKTWEGLPSNAQMAQLYGFSRAFRANAPCPRRCPCCSAGMKGVPLKCLDAPNCLTLHAL
jgi:hypothetical protein